MDRQILEIRANDITSTEVSVLFNCCPYKTFFELWHEKRSKAITQIDANERMVWGTRLQSAIARGIAEDNGWLIREKSEYIRTAEKLGASFDFEVETPVKALLEIKNVDALQFRDGWIVDGDYVEAPPHIELQVQHQMLVSGISRAYIGALIGGNKVILIYRELDSAIAAEIKSRAAAFWETIESNKEPNPVFPEDSAAVISLYNHAEPNKCLLLQEGDEVIGLVERYKEASALVKAHEEAKQEIKAQILMRIGDAEKAVAKGFSISAGMVGPAHVEYDREGYRTFRVNFKKKK